MLPAVGKFVDRVFPNEKTAKSEKIKIEWELPKQLKSVDPAHIRINKVGAAVEHPAKAMASNYGMCECLGFCLSFLGAAHNCLHSELIGAYHSTAKI